MLEWKVKGQGGRGGGGKSFFPRNGRPTRGTFKFNPKKNPWKRKKKFQKLPHGKTPFPRVPKRFELFGDAE